MPAPAQGNAQLVLLNGAHVDSAFQVNGVLQFDPGSIANSTSKTYQVFYGNAAATGHSVALSWSQNQTTGTPLASSYTTHLDAQNNVVVDTTTWARNWVNDGALATAISVSLDSAEVAKVGAGGVHVAWRAAGSGSGFPAANDSVLGKSGNIYSGSLALGASTSIDLKVWYIDTGNREVIVEWRTLSLPAQPASSAAPPVTTSGTTQPTAVTRTVAVGSAQSYGGSSLIVLGRELDGTLTRSGASLSIAPGLAIGAIHPGSAAFAATVGTTASAGAGSLQASGLSTSSYFTSFAYDDIGNKIGTNETTGLWRRFGVDAMGNAQKTSTYGTKDDEDAGKSAIITYAAYDARGLEVARFGAAVQVDPNGDGVENASAVRAVTRFGYDYDRRKTSEIDPGNTASNAQSFVYNALGQLVSQTDALGHTTTIDYDRRGNETRRTDALGHASRHSYNLAGRKTADIDALGNTTSFTLDAFGRITAITDARGNATAMQYDQHDRLVKTTDALSNITEYAYDKRDNRTWTKDANGNFFGVAYDNMRRVSARYAYSGGAPTSFADAADAVGNAANAAHAFLIGESAEYDVYGNKIGETDAEGREKRYRSPR